jgi:tight adherence protein B
MTMTVTEYALLALWFVGAWLLIRSLYERIEAWWTRRMDAYAAWMGVELESMFEEMALSRARQLITVAVLGGISFGFLLGQGIVGRLVLGAAMGVMSYFAPRLFIIYRKAQRLLIIDNQLVDALTLMSNALKSGMNLQQSFEMVVKELKPPITDEFGRVVKEIQLGRLTDDALRNLAARVPLPDLRLAVESILTLRETGGNLTETFQVIATTIVERKKVEGKIKAMTAQGMTQGIAMCLMPIFFLFLFSLIDPSYTRPMFQTPLGLVMLVVMMLLQAAGLGMMLKIVKIRV